MEIVLVDGLPVDVSNADTAKTLVARLIAARDTATAAVEASQNTIAARDATIAERDAEIVTLKDAAEKAKLSPQAIRDAAASYARTCARAKALGVTVGDEMDEPAIKAAAVALKMGDAAKGYTPEQNAAAFDVLAAGVKDAPAAVVDAAADPLRAALADGQPVTLGDADKKFQDARAARFARFGSAHLGTKED